MLLQVGKTSLINALQDEYGKSQPIAPELRTVSVQVSRQLLDDGADLRIWDFAGELLALAFLLSRNCRLNDTLLSQGRRFTTSPTPFISLSAASTS